MRKHVLICFMVFLCSMHEVHSDENKVDANTCVPQPDCKINYPAVAPGASSRIIDLGSKNAIGRSSGGPGPVGVGGIGLHRLCVPWC
jgi:hypothetical protein